MALAPRSVVNDPKGGEANLNGEMVYLWRAVDQEGEILESHARYPRLGSCAQLHEGDVEASWIAQALSEQMHRHLPYWLDSSTTAS